MHLTHTSLSCIVKNINQLKKGATMDDKKYTLLIEQISNINKSLNTHNKIMSVFLKFALDSSSFKSKTTEEIKATAEKQNEILKTINESNF